MSENKFCKYCGKQLSEDFKLCPYCGEKVEEEILEIPCPSCGKTIKSDFKICPYCGNNYNNKKENYNNYNTENRTNYNSNNYRENYNTENKKINYSNSSKVSPKSGITCLLLSIFLPPFHRFYAGKTDSAVSMLLYYIYFYVSLISGARGRFSTVLFVFVSIILPIVYIIDLVTILRGKFQDSKGRYIKLNN